MQNPIVKNDRQFKKTLKKKIEAVTKPLEKEIEANGMALVSVQQGPMSQTLIMPVVDGKPIPPEQLKAMVAEGMHLNLNWKSSKPPCPSIKNRCRKTSRKVNEIIREAGKEANQLVETVARESVRGIYQDGSREVRYRTGQNLHRKKSSTMLSRINFSEAKKSGLISRKSTASTLS